MARPNDYVAKPLELVKPKIAPTLAPRLDGSRERPAVAPETRERKERRAVDKVFVDMEPADGGKWVEPKAGSALANAIAAMPTSLDKIQSAIGPKHDALKLLRWASENRRVGFRKNADGAIEMYHAENK